MRVALASDHAGFLLKQEINTLLASEGHETTDFGTHGEDACDLVDFAYPAALAVGRSEVDRAIMVDGVGYGSAMIANRVRGVDAVVCQDPFCAGLARSHTDSNVLCIGGKIIGSALALAVVETWMRTEFLAGEDKYVRRVAKAREVAERHLRRLDGL
jgi:ribose 5-phosphate isomerase B